MEKGNSKDLPGHYSREKKPDPFCSGQAFMGEMQPSCVDPKLRISRHIIPQDNGFVNRNGRMS